MSFLFGGERGALFTHNQDTLGSLVGEFHVRHLYLKSMVKSDLEREWRLKLTDWLGAGPAVGRAPKWRCSRSSIGPAFEC